MLDGRSSETFKKKGDQQRRQKLLMLTVDELRNVGGEGGSCWMAGQVRHLEKRDRQGRQEVLIR